ncbi:MAG: alpha/beta hydrolase [Actinobacteria bacterium]|nr:alpha/beta hydrolase [Actinomycetota bacterium]
MSLLLLMLSVVAAALGWNAVRTTRGRFGPWWFPALLTGELAPFHASGQLLLAAGFWWAGWAGGWAGRTGLALLGVSIVLLAVNHLRGLGTRRVLESAVAEATGHPVRMPPARWTRMLRPYPAPPGSIEVVRDAGYGPDPAHRLDRFSIAGGGGGRPVLLQVHGGGWTGGRRDQQARPLVHRMAAAGWVVYSISYRLSPRATFPDHLVDVKRAIAWIRRHGREHGADPSFLAITGGSAGGQLAALAALTSDRLEYQPGFEDADTAVQACVPLYGVHDLLDRSGTRPKWPYLSRYVLKAEPAEQPALWDAAAPVRAARSDRPPFLIVHGSADSLVRPGESRRLAAALRAEGPVPVGLAEIPGATHGFDALHSLRAERTVDGIQMVLEHLWERHRASQDESQDEWVAG